ncbi:hypothetical protein BX600DRAFT_465483 [Xylariales sp. PMI_506]|nr:hypothetical protein BX600DRAFT_465483 [Xylariales sp. PMI_506]
MSFLGVSRRLTNHIRSCHDQIDSNIKPSSEAVYFDSYSIHHHHHTHPKNSSQKLLLALHQRYHNILVITTNFQASKLHHIVNMGAVVSCIEGLFRTIGSCLMAIVNGVASILTAIIHGIASFLDILISFLTCGYCGGRRRGRGGTTGRRHRTTTSRI